MNVFCGADALTSLIIGALNFSERESGGGRSGDVVKRLFLGELVSLNTDTFGLF